VIQHETAHLAVDWLDRLWVKEGAQFVGFMVERPPWPAALGPEPEWYPAELELLRFVWEETSRLAREYWMTVNDTYRRPQR
jgi:hypothetical protein